MTTAIAKHGGNLPATSMAELATAGDLLAQANFLGTRSPGEGFLVMAACHQTGMSLVEFQQKYHLRQGRFSMQAHAMLAEFVDRGGSYKILARTPERAAIEFSKDGNVYLSEITWEDAQNEPFIYAGREDDQLAALTLPLEKRRIKSKYQTPRSRMQMLWARAVSDGVVVVDPGARGGIYTPEEMDDVAEAQARGPMASEPVPLSQAEARSRMAAAGFPVVDAAVADVEPEPDPASTNAVPEPEQADPSLCPIPGPLYGTPWAAMTTETLELALKIPRDQMSAEHFAAVNEAIARKEQ